MHNAAKDQWDEAFNEAWDFVAGLYDEPPRNKQYESTRIVLNHLPAWAIAKAASQAPSRWPTKFPVANEWKSAVVNIVREDAPPDETPSYDYTPPQLTADNPFRQLAERWEDESRAKGFSPDKPCPRVVGKRRMQELGDLMAEHF